MVGRLEPRHALVRYGPRLPTKSACMISGIDEKGQKTKTGSIGGATQAGLGVGVGVRYCWVIGAARRRIWISFEQLGK
jgi:hypothetical protein